MRRRLSTARGVVGVEPPDGCLRTDRRDLRDVFFQPQPADRHLEAILHAGIVGVQVAGEAAVLELQAVGILEVDRLCPTVIDDGADLNAFANEFLSFLPERDCVAGLECEMIDAAGESEAKVDPASYSRGTPGTSRGSMKAINWSWPVSKKIWRIFPPSSTVMVSQTTGLKPSTPS